MHSEEISSQNNDDGSNLSQRMEDVDLFFDQSSYIKHNKIGLPKYDVYSLSQNPDDFDSLVKQLIDHQISLHSYKLGLAS